MPLQTLLIVETPVSAPTPLKINQKLAEPCIPSLGSGCGAFYGIRGELFHDRLELGHGFFIGESAA